MILKKQGESKSEGHNVYTEIINKIALSPNDEYNRLMQSRHMHMEHPLT